MELVKELILGSPKKIVITSHHKPDGDAIGSSLGLYNFLIQLGHEVTPVMPNDYPESIHWMEGDDKVVEFEKEKVKATELLNKAEIIFTLDYNALHRVNEMGEVIGASSAFKIMIDHHLSPQDYADFMISNPNASSTAELVFKFIEGLDRLDLMNPAISNCLYTGILTDTGSFAHNVKPSVLNIAGELLKYGAEHDRIRNEVFNSYNEERLKFLGFALSEKLIVLPEFKAGIIHITPNDLKAFNSKTGDTEGLVNYILRLKGINFAALVIDRTVMVKISFRSKGSFSVNEFARNHFEGGGHRNAAGGKSLISLKKTVQKIKDLLPQYKEQLNY